MGSEMLTAISETLGMVESDVMDVLLIVGGIAIAIIGVFLAWKLGVRFFRGLIGDLNNNDYYHKGRNDYDPDLDGYPDKYEYNDIYDEDDDSFH